MEKIRTRYCQLVSPNNRIKSCAKDIYEENYHDFIHADECTVETWIPLLIN